MEEASNGHVVEIKSPGSDQNDIFKPKDLMYGIDDKPPWYLAMLLGLQVCQ